MPSTKKVLLFAIRYLHDAMQQSVLLRCYVTKEKSNNEKKTSLKMSILYISLRCDDERTVKMISEMKSNKCCNDG